MATQPAVLGTGRLNNFRLAYLSADLRPIRATRVGIFLSGLWINSRVRINSLRIADILNDAPNTCALTIQGPTIPMPSQRLVVTLDVDAPITLFAGTLQTVGISYEGRPGQVVYPCSAIDDTALANRRRPFGAWTATSATTIAIFLVATYAPGLSTAGIEANLPTVDVNFDGTEGMSGAFQQLAKLVGGYFKFEDGTAYLFTVYPTDDPPDPIDTAHPFLNDPPISSSRDVSQLRTRVWGKGHGQQVIADVLAYETILPIADAVMFGTMGTGGGRAIAGTTPDGGQSQPIAYASVQQASGGSLVGPGAAPSTKPVVVPAFGLGLGVGVYRYAYTDVTAVGESLPSPIGTVATGVTAPPATALTAGPATGGAGLDLGSHEYVLTNVTASGETSPGPISSPVTTTVLASPPTACSASNSVGLSNYHNAWKTGDTVAVAITFVTVYGGGAGAPQTQLGPMSNAFVAQRNTNYSDPSIAWCAHLVNIPQPPPGNYFRIWFNVNGAWVGYEEMAGFYPTKDSPIQTWYGAAPPTVNTATIAKVPLTAIPVSPDGVTTARKLYRRFNGAGIFRLVNTIPDNRTTTYTDITPNASLGAAAPSTNTATTQQVAIDSVALGPAAVTARKIYRTAVNGTQLKLLTTFANNTQTGSARGTADPTTIGTPVIGNTYDSGGLTGTHQWKFTFVRLADGAETGPTPASASLTSTRANVQIPLAGCSTPPPGYQRQWYRTQSNGTTFYRMPAAYGLSSSTPLWGELTTVFSDLLDDSGLLYLDGTPAPTTWIGPYVDAAADTALGANVPTGDTSGLTQPSGQVNAGSTALLLASAGPFDPAGGWTVNGIRYTGISGNTLTGIPASGPGAIVTTVIYGAQVLPAPALIGVSGLSLPMQKGAMVAIWIQRDDLAAQATQAAIDAANGVVPADGIYEGPPIVDERRGEASLIALCDATLDLFSAPIQTVRYSTRDVKTRSGKSVTVTLASPPITADLVIQDVQISEIDLAPGLPPRFDVTASTTRFSLDNLLRQLTGLLGGQ